MLTDNWGAFAVATGMWIIASVTLIASDAKTPPDGLVWTSASSDKVASHPTLVRRALPSNPAPVRTAALGPAR
jgi:hypothetical protein